MKGLPSSKDETGKHRTINLFVSQYCEKYVMLEDVVATAAEKSSDEEHSEDGYTPSEDEEIAEKLDP
ncbi:hypothetical protein Gotri_022842 [Gossypium trilobum]|uniref:Uncharacterized protein n=1 Tax=Gossypium trilobum TaxID=34281 RepID=A0A7J9DH16_9ROSI|nr:hypothetical protein [Gossypium trilobum]